MYIYIYILALTSEKCATIHISTFIYLYVMVLEFKLRALYLLGRHSIA
jgi:hypothetical protein